MNKPKIYVAVLGCLVLAGLFAGVVVLKSGLFSDKSTNSPPEADFSVLSENVWVGDTVQFTNLSVSNGGTIQSTRWEFGDEEISIAENICHIYHSAEIYTIGLTVTDSNGATNTCYKTVSVSEMRQFHWISKSEWYESHCAYQRRTWYENVVIIGELQSYQNLSHVRWQGESVLKFVTPEDEKIAELANHLKLEYQTVYPFAEPYEFPYFVLTFVQAIPYKIHENWQYPIETLLNNGMCSSKSILYASLMKAEGYEVCLLEFAPDNFYRVSNHMLVGIHLDSSPPYTNPEALYYNAVWKVYTINGENYYPCETTIEGWNIGEMNRTIAVQTPEITVVV
jgi:hypothetical protein